MANGLARSLIQGELQAHTLGIVVSAGEAMVLARFRLALNSVAVGNFAFCHGCEATILAFVSAMRTIETRRNGGNGVVARPCPGLNADSRLLFSRHQLCHAFLRNGFVIMQHTQRWKRMQQLISLQQEHRVAGSASKTLLLRGVCLVDQMSTWFDRSRQSREELTLQKEKDDVQVVFLPAKVLHGIQVMDFRRDGRSRSCPLRIFLSLIDADLRYIQQMHAPA